MRRNSLAGRWFGVAIIMVLVLLLFGAVAVMAQTDGLNPNDVGEQNEEPEAIMAAEEMVGKSPNSEAIEPVISPPDDRDMVGRSPNEAEGVMEQGVIAPSALFTVNPNGRSFFITQASVNGAAADTACPDGFHMASFYEMADVTDLVYIAGAGGVAAKTRTDQGGGPVAGWWGWARTGGDASTANQAGVANCSLWESDTAGEYGSLVQLNPTWTSAAVTVSPWRSQTWSCGGTAPVWCIED